MTTELAGVSVSISENTTYTIRVDRKQGLITAWVEEIASSEVTYDGGADLGTGYSGMFSKTVNVKFDDFQAYAGYSRDPIRSPAMSVSSVRCPRCRRGVCWCWVYPS